jgi:hypothetical protein
MQCRGVRLVNGNVEHMHMGGMLDALNNLSRPSNMHTYSSVLNTRFKLSISVNADPVKVLCQHIHEEMFSAKSI